MLDRDPTKTIGIPKLSSTRTKAQATPQYRLSRKLASKTFFVKEYLKAGHHSININIQYHKKGTVKAIDIRVTTSLKVTDLLLWASGFPYAIGASSQL
jgi:hypothetical protein